MPAGKMIHVILDNCGSHKHPKLMAWLADQPSENGGSFMKERGSRGLIQSLAMLRVMMVLLMLSVPLPSPELWAAQVSGPTVPVITSSQPHEP